MDRVSFCILYRFASCRKRSWFTEAIVMEASWEVILCMRLMLVLPSDLQIVSPSLIKEKSNRSIWDKCNILEYQLSKLLQLIPHRLMTLEELSQRQKWFLTLCNKKVYPSSPFTMAQTDISWIFLRYFSPFVFCWMRLLSLQFHVFYAINSNKSIQQKLHCGSFLILVVVVYFFFFLKQVSKMKFSGNVVRIYELVSIPGFTMDGTTCRRCSSNIASFNQESRSYDQTSRWKLPGKRWTNHDQTMDSSRRSQRVHV